jgi:YidC/Oxa1 family membrane protein insertase
MSQQRPAPNPILTVLLWGAFFFLGWQILQGGGCGGNKAANDARTMEKVYESIVALNKDGNDTALAQEVAIYQRKLTAEKDAGRITGAEVEERTFDVSIIKIETAYVNALRTNNQGKLNNAYTNEFKSLQGKYGATAYWKRQVPVAPVEGKIEGSTVTPEALDDLIRTDLSAMNKSAKVLGYIPGFHMMEFLVGLTGNSPGFSYWFAALMLAILVRLAVFPLAQKQYMWGRRMSQLAPYIKEIQEKFKDKKTGKVTDQQAMTLETMDLYKRYGFNPFAGCLPALIQLPLFLIIYQCMLLYRFEFTKGYFLWIHPGSSSFLGLPLAPNLGERDYLIIIVYGISMVITTLLTPVSDPTNVRQQRMIGISIALLFSVMMFFWPLPSAFVVYWVFTNILATAQSLYVYRMPVAPLEQVQTTAGGAIPTTSRDLNGKTNVDPGFFGKTGKGSSKKKRKR